MDTSIIYYKVQIPGSRWAVLIDKLFVERKQ